MCPYSYRTPNMYICSKFAHFLLLVCLMSISLLEQQKNLESRRKIILLPPHNNYRVVLTHQIKIIMKYHEEVTWYLYNY